MRSGIAGSLVGLALLLGLPLAGCGGAAAPSPVPLALSSGGNPPHFLAQIADAPFQVAYHARRRVSQSFQDANGPQTLVYLESAWSDGQGHFSVTPEQVLQPALPSQAEQVFLLMQKAREGFIYRLRDFRIRELDAFLQAYTVEDLNQRVDVAGQTCERLRIRPTSAGPSYWELDVDPATGLILSTREFLQSGTLVGEVETLSYEANPDLSGIALHQDLPTVPFTAANAQQVLGFAPLQPTFLPRDYVLASSEKITQGADVWARYGYTNGGETLFLLYRREPLGGLPTTDPAGPYTMKIFHAGLWTVAQASFGRHQIAVLGREPAGILQQVLESCAR